MYNDTFEEDLVEDLASSGGGRKVSCDDMSNLEFEPRDNYKYEEVELYHLKDLVKK